MMPVYRLVDYTWLLWFVVWVGLGFFKHKPTARAERTSRFVVRVLLPLLVMILGGVLLQAFEPGLLQRGVFRPLPPVVVDTGLGLLYAGLLLSFWPRYVLGRNWSGRITIKHGHELVTRGPYRYVRHPIYTALILAFLGTALIANTVLYDLFFAGLIAGLVVKARMEESYLTEAFGAQYREYQSRTGLLFPRLRARA